SETNIYAHLHYHAQTTPASYPLSLHDALPILERRDGRDDEEDEEQHPGRHIEPQRVDALGHRSVREPAASHTTAHSWGCQAHHPSSPSCRACATTSSS